MEALNVGEYGSTLARSSVWGLGFGHEQGRACPFLLAMTVG